MANLQKETTRLDVVFIDKETNEVIMEVNNRDHSDVGQMFVDPYVSDMLTRKFGDDGVPDEVTVMVTAVFKKIKD